VRNGVHRGRSTRDKLKRASSHLGSVRQFPRQSILHIEHINGNWLKSCHGSGKSALAFFSRDRLLPELLVFKHNLLLASLLHVDRCQAANRATSCYAQNIITKSVGSEPIPPLQWCSLNVITFKISLYKCIRANSQHPSLDERSLTEAKWRAN